MQQSLPQDALGQGGKLLLWKIHPRLVGRGVNQADRLLFVTSPSFDLSVYDVFGTLAGGGTIVIPSNEALREPSQLAELLAQEQVTAEHYDDDYFAAGGTKTNIGPAGQVTGSAHEMLR